MDRFGVGSLRSAALGLGAALFLFVVAPETTPSDARLYLDRAAALQDALPPGSGQPFWPASTAWIAYPLSAVQRAAAAVDGAPTRAGYLETTAALWRTLLRAVWSLLAGLLVARAAGSWTPASGALGGAAIALCLLGAPLLSVGVARLLPAVPAGLLAGELLAFAASDRPSSRAGWRLGILGGLLLGWFPFAWIALPLAWALRWRGGSTRGALAGAAALAVFLAVAIEPARLLQPASILERALGEWRREGGWSGEGGPGLLSLLGLVPLLGASAWILWALAIGRARDPGRRARLAAGVALWLAAILLPAAGGVRRPGNLQWAVAPWLLIWGLEGFASARAWGSRPRLGWATAGVVVLAGALPARWIGHSETARLAKRIETVREEARALIGPGELAVSELPLAEGDSAAPRVFVLPRDSRSPGRYDFAYWSRWYAGFRWVLLSGRRVADHLGRDGADLPRRFYAEVERHGELEREWGRGESGFRLYRLREGSAWNRPFTEEELGVLPGGGERTWFFSQLGSLYLEAGDARAAEAIFRVGLRGDPESATLYGNLGSACLRLNDPAAAARALEAGLRLAPQSFELLWNLGLACSMAGLWERGERVLRRAAAARPDFAPVHYELGRVFLAQGKDELARQAFRRFLELDPSSERRDAVELQLRRLAGEDGR